MNSVQSFQLLIRAGIICVAIAIVVALVIIVQTTLDTTGHHMSEYGAALREQTIEIRKSNDIMEEIVKQNSEIIQKHNFLLNYLVR